MIKITSKRIGTWPHLNVKSKSKNREIIQESLGFSYLFNQKKPQNLLKFLRFLLLFTTMKKYIIEVSEDQLKLIANCLEDISRFASGQVNFENTMENIVNNEMIGLTFNEQIERKHLAEEKLEEVRKVLFPNMHKNSSYGYNRTNFIGNTYQIYRTIYHQLAVDNNWNNVYSSKPLPSGNMGNIKVKQVKE